MQCKNVCEVAFYKLFHDKQKQKIAFLSPFSSMTCILFYFVIEHCIYFKKINLIKYIKIILSSTEVNITQT